MQNRSTTQRNDERDTLVEGEREHFSAMIVQSDIYRYM